MQDTKKKVSPKEKFSLVFKLGAIVENIFFEVCKLNNIPIIKGSDISDRRDRIDFWIRYDNAIWGVDVKARRRVTRCNFDEWAIFYEIKNGYGTPNTNKRFTHIAYEIAPATFIVVPKRIIIGLIKEHAKGFKLYDYTKGERAKINSFYTRNGKDLMVIFDEEWFINTVKGLPGVVELYADPFEESLESLIVKEFEIYKEIKEGCWRKRIKNRQG
jgi:hypothetical protein